MRPGGIENPRLGAIETPSLLHISVALVPGDRVLLASVGLSQTLTPDARLQAGPRSRVVAVRNH